VAEGDTAHATAADLHAALAGRPLVATDLRVPRFATADLSGRVLEGIEARGKHLLMRTDGGETVHSHLGLDGSWRLYRSKERWRAPAHEVRAVLRVEGLAAVGVRLRTLEVVATSRETDVIGHLGPDPLAPDWDPTEALRRLTFSPHRPVGEVLLDQTVIAGPGNVYRSEVCFLAGTHPLTPVGDLPDPAALVALTASCMRSNAQGGRRSTTGDRRPGRELWVYGRAGRPCRRCSTPVRSIRITSTGGARTAYLCPACQPAPAAAASASTS
jgi:endonuclease-8